MAIQSEIDAESSHSEGISKSANHFQKASCLQQIVRAFFTFSEMCSSQL